MNQWSNKQVARWCKYSNTFSLHFWWLLRSQIRPSISLVTSFFPFISIHSSTYFSNANFILIIKHSWNSLLAEYLSFTAFNRIRHTQGFTSGKQWSIELVTSRFAFQRKIFPSLEEWIEIIENCSLFCQNQSHKQSIDKMSTELNGTWRLQFFVDVILFLLFRFWIPINRNKELRCFLVCPIGCQPEC